jgi:hypothetical protein
MIGVTLNYAKIFPRKFDSMQMQNLIRGFSIGITISVPRSQRLENAKDNKKTPIF